MKPRVIAIIQGQMSSSHLPGKILVDIAEQLMLQRVFARASRAATVSETIFDIAKTEKFRAKGFVTPLPIPTEGQVS